MGPARLQHEYHSHRLGRHRLQVPVLLYSFFLAALIIDIGGSFGLKYAAFASVLIYLIALAITNEIRIPSSFLILEGGLFIMAPVLFLILAIAVFSVEPATAALGLFPFGTWLLYPLILQIQPKEKILSYFTTTIFYGAIFIILIFCSILVLNLYGYNELINKIYIFTYEYGLGYFGSNPLGNSISLFLPNVYPRWTLLLIPASILLLHGNTKQLIILIIATLLTTSTAAILFLMIGLFWASFENILRGKISKVYFKKILIFLVILFLSACTLYLLGYNQIFYFLANKLGDSPSTSVKIGHITSIIDIISTDLVTLILGMGVGSSFWSTGVNEMVTNVEVSHFNLIRQFGLPYALAFFSYILLLVIRLHRLRDENGRLLSIGLMVLFIAVGTNPLLLSPVFFLMLVISRAYITLKERENLAKKINGSV